MDQRTGDEPPGAAIGAVSTTGIMAQVQNALAGSRERWRSLAVLSADLAFETDTDGRISFLYPDGVLGRDATALLGRPADELLAEPGGLSGFNPFRQSGPVRARRAWLRSADGEVRCFSFDTAPMIDRSGAVRGCRGVARDITATETEQTMLAAALRRCEVVDHILWSMRQEVMAPRMMQSALEAMRAALGARGVSVLVPNAAPFGQQPGEYVRDTAGEPAPPAPDAVRRLLHGGRMETVCEVAEDGSQLLACACETRFGLRATLQVWRGAGTRPWGLDDASLLSSAVGILRVILEHDCIQQEMARQARTDPLTGLLNRRAFNEEVALRVSRLDREGIPGTLMFVDIDFFKKLNDLLGHEAGDEALAAIGSLLRATVRPSDLVARLGGDEFALWLDGMEEFTASERAESLRVEGPRVLAAMVGRLQPSLPQPSFGLSIGIATRWPGRGEDVDCLIHRADQVMYEVKRGGRGQWRVSRTDAW